MMRIEVPPNAWMSVLPVKKYDGRHHRDGGDEDAAGKRHAVQHVLDVRNGGRARTHAGDKTALLAQVVGRVLGLNTMEV